MLWYLSETVTDKVFDIISRELGGADWRRLGLRLGLTDKELDNLKTNHPLSILACITAMLRQWRGNPITEASMTVLRAALVDIQRNDLAAFIGKFIYPPRDLFLFIKGCQPIIYGWPTQGSTQCLSAFPEVVVHVEQVD